MIVVVEIDVISFRLVNILSFLVNHCSYMFGFVLVVYFYYIFVVVVLGKKKLKGSCVCFLRCKLDGNKFYSIGKIMSEK